MSIQSPDPSQEARWFARSLGVFAFVALACLIVSFTEPESWIGSLEEYSPFQNLQAAVLGVAFFANLYAIFRTAGDRRNLFAFALFFTFFLFWREMDLDKEFLHARMFSWTYLFKSDDKIPLVNKILLGAFSIGTAVSWLVFAALRFGSIRRSIAAHLQPRIVFWAALTFLLLFLAQIWDKASMIARHVHVVVHDMADKDPFDEEALELVGEVGVLFLVLAVMRTPPRPMREAWNEVWAWIETPKGRRTVGLAGAALVLCGLGLTALSAVECAAHHPGPYEYELAVNLKAEPDEFAIEYTGLGRGELGMYGLGLALGTAFAGFGLLLALRKLKWRNLAVVAALAAATLALPFVFKEQSLAQDARITVNLEGSLSAERLEDIRARLAPATAMATLPAHLLKKIGLQVGEGLESVVLSASDSSIVCILDFVDPADTRARHTLMEFYQQYLNILVEEAAQLQGLELPVASRPDYTPWRVSGQHFLPESFWHKFAEDWLKRQREGNG
ncbi:MAG: hypothetical protein M5U26_14865 [Planctomycetota bacterium]|nr:hypothetical protein [Planctomycetota bacterium]